MNKRESETEQKTIIDSLVENEKIEFVKEVDQIPLEISKYNEEDFFKIN